MVVSEKQNGGSTSGSRKGMGKKRAGPNPDKQGTAAYDLALFLHHQLDVREWTVPDFFERLRQHGFDRKNDDTINKWIEATSSPSLNHLPVVASALGYESWFHLIAAVSRHSSKS